PRVRGDAAQSRRVVPLPRRAGRHELRLRRSLRLDPGVPPARDVEDERNLKRHDHEHEHIREGGQQPAAERHAQASSAVEKRKPTPRTVWMYRGDPGSSSSFFRSPLTWTSSVFVEPNQFVSHPSSISRSRVTTEPAFSIRRRRRSNSLRLSSSSSPRNETLRRPGSMRTSPISAAPSTLRSVASAARRSTALTRATSSRRLKSFTT